MKTRRSFLGFTSNRLLLNLPSDMLLGFYGSADLEHVLDTCSMDAATSSSSPPPLPPPSSSFPPLSFSDVHFSP